MDVIELLKKALGILSSGKSYSKRGACTDEYGEEVPPFDPRAARFDPVGVLASFQADQDTVKEAANRLIDTLHSNDDYAAWGLGEFGMHRPREYVLKLYEAAIEGRLFETPPPRRRPPADATATTNMS